MKKEQCLTCKEMGEICPLHFYENIFIKEALANKPKTFLGNEWWEWLEIIAKSTALACLLFPLLTHLGFQGVDRGMMIFGISWICAKHKLI